MQNATHRKLILLALGVLSTPYCVLGSHRTAPPNQIASTAQIDFETQIIPVLTKAGCNSGACHGAAIGRGGFRLSLLGYDPQADYDSLVNEFEGRRVNRADAEKSLVLRKPSLDVDHEGGLRLQPGGDGFQLIRDWIAAGAPRGPTRRLVKIDVSPRSHTLARPNEQFAVRVRATFTTDHVDQQSAISNHQSSEDVTRWSVFTPADPAALDVTPRGEVTVRRRGQNTLMVRFLGEVAAVTVTVALGDTRIAGERPRANFIDDHINRTLDELHLPHSPPADAATLLRRLYLDLIGTLPDPAEIAALASTDPASVGIRLTATQNASTAHVSTDLVSVGARLITTPYEPTALASADLVSVGRRLRATVPAATFLTLLPPTQGRWGAIQEVIPNVAASQFTTDARSVGSAGRVVGRSVAASEDEAIERSSAPSIDAIIERLMNRPEFVDHWSYKWGDLLRIESRRLQPDGAAAFHRWVRECVARNTPLDAMAREMMLALGDSYTVGPAGFSRVPTDARSHAEHVSRVFMGVRLQCANCHNHPLDRWTQDDYHGLAAVFARLGRGREVKLLPRGDVIHPKTGQPALPRIPGVAFIDAEDPESQRERLSAWLTSPDNPFFARAAVNRIWHELMGRGLVEPIDDHRATNPATHPELLDALARDFVAHGFDVRHTIRTIVASEAYQRSSRSVAGNQSDDRFYSHAIVRPLPPPVLVDAVAKVTGVPEKLGELPAGTRAIALADSRVPSQPLDLLGRCSRDAECSPPNDTDGSLPLTLHTINGPWLNAKITDPAGRLTQLVDTGADDETVVRELYVAGLSRRPTARELTHWKTRLVDAGRDARRAVAQDFMWALLNSTEFCCNH